MKMKKKIGITFLGVLLSLNLALAQEADADAPYRGGSGDGYAMAELLVHSQPTAVNKVLEQATRLYPNPLKKGEQLILQTANTVKIDYIRLIDSQGNLLFEKGQKDIAADEAPLRIPTHRWPAGIYFLQLESRQSTITKKLILL